MTAACVNRNTRHEYFTVKEYRPSERIVDRAVSIWRRLLENPRYDNGDTSFPGGMCMAMAKMIPNNANADRLDSFCGHLRKWLLSPDDEQRGTFWSKQSLAVDYGPGRGLIEAAAASGLKMEFPWKTSMWINDDHLHVRAGYSAETFYHYPLADGRWLVTTLSGSEISKVIEYIGGGKPEFHIEE